MADFASIRFQPSRPLLRELSADRLNSILTEIKQNKPKGERGITVRQTGEGTYIGLATSLSKSSTSTAIDHPFFVHVRKAADSNTYFWGVDYKSRCFKDLSPGDEGIIDGGVLTAARPENDPAWFEINAPDYLYLEYDAENDTVTIKTASIDDTFDPEADTSQEKAFLELDIEELPLAHKFSRKMIAKAEPPTGEDTAPRITQGIKSNQLLQDVLYDGNPVRWFFDYTPVSL
jgi:hypothetical protein